MRIRLTFRSFMWNPTSQPRRRQRGGHNLSMRIMSRVLCMTHPSPRMERCTGRPLLSACGRQLSPVSLRCDCHCHSRVHSVFVTATSSDFPCSVTITVTAESLYRVSLSRQCHCHCHHTNKSFTQQTVSLSLSPYKQMIHSADSVTVTVTIRTYLVFIN